MVRLDWSLDGDLPRPQASPLVGAVRSCYANAPTRRVVGQCAESGLWVLCPENRSDAKKRGILRVVLAVSGGAVAVALVAFIVLVLVMRHRFLEDLGPKEFIREGPLADAKSVPSWCRWIDIPEGASDLHFFRTGGRDPTLFVRFRTRIQVAEAYLDRFGSTSGPGRPEPPPRWPMHEAPSWWTPLEAGNARWAMLGGEAAGHYIAVDLDTGTVFECNWTS